jgi:hypothetical protein
VFIFKQSEASPPIIKILKEFFYFLQNVNFFSFYCFSRQLPAVSDLPITSMIYSNE